MAVRYLGINLKQCTLRGVIRITANVDLLCEVAVLEHHSFKLALHPPFCKASVSGSGFSAFRSQKFNNKKMKKLILKVIEWAIYRMSEYTPPEVKYSERNYRVAKAALAVGELRELL